MRLGKRTGSEGREHCGTLGSVAPQSCGVSRSSESLTLFHTCADTLHRGGFLWTSNTVSAWAKNTRKPNRSCAVCHTPRARVSRLCAEWSLTSCHGLSHPPNVPTTPKEQRRRKERVSPGMGESSLIYLPGVCPTLPTDWNFPQSPSTIRVGPPTTTSHELIPMDSEIDHVDIYVQ